MDNTFLQRILKSFEQALQLQCESLYPGSSVLHQACRYAMNGQGKRVRPLLTMLSCEALGGQAVDAHSPAIAIEMIHTYSLIHDDLPAFDNDAVRRGRPTLHVRFDEPTAILAGDALLTDAWQVLADGQKPGPQMPQHEAQRRLAMVMEISRAAGAQGMALGQALDIYWTGRSGFTADDLEGIHLKKTGLLIAASCVCGALSVTDDPVVCLHLRDFGLFLGLAFQILDDVLDQRSGTGKSPGKDADQKKLTYLQIMDADTALDLASGWTEKAFQSLDRIPGEFSKLKEFSQMLLMRTR